MDREEPHGADPSEPDRHALDRLDTVALQPGMEPLTPAEKEAFLARVRSQGRTLTSEEQYALFGPPAKPAAPSPPPPEVEEMMPAVLDAAQIAALGRNFFPELGDPEDMPAPSLVRGVVFDFDDTLATLARPWAGLLEEGARAAEAYMRGAGMQLPAEFWSNIVEARRFALEKSDEEQEEHIADDAMSFLLQFYGYPASRMDPEVLRRAVDVFYAPEMTAWRLRPGVPAMLAGLQQAGLKLALIAHYSADRVFQRIVDYLGIRDYFDLVLCSAAVEYRKPDPQLLEPVLDRWDVLPYEVVVVGDSLRHDVQAGAALGALTVLLEAGTDPQVAHENAQLAAAIVPDARIATLDQLPALIHAWAQP
jgi:HAD superfamily hydrolase (TIGR01509 family)